MDLPGAEHGYIPTSKLQDYILSEQHPIGRFKSKLFRAWGFHEMNLHLLKQGLLSIAQTGAVKEHTTFPFGIKYVIDGRLQTPQGRSIPLRTVWMVDKEQTRPRFLTAYPL